MAQYEDFIPQNTAPVGVKRIGVYNSNNKRVGIIKLGGLAKAKGEKLYSFGAISDVHLQRNTGTTDFPRALTFFTTLSLQLALADNGLRTLYVSGEESAEQIKMRAQRIGINNECCTVYTETLLENIVSVIEEQRPRRQWSYQQ